MKAKKKSSRREELLSRAKNAFTIGDFSSAEKTARTLIGEEPALPASYILLGTIFGKQRMYPEAIGQFEKALELQPDNAEALNNLGVMYRQTGKLGQSLKSVEKSIELKPGSADMWYNLGNIHKMDDNIPAAVEAYTKAVELDPEFVLAYNNLGTLYEKVGDYGKAADVFNQGLRSDPNHPTLRYNLGIALQARGDLEGARKQFEMSVRSRPGWTDGLNNLGIVLQQTEKYEEAVGVFKEILAIDPKNVTANNNIATILAQQGRTKEAIDFYRKALDENPGYRKAAVNLGQILEKQEVSGEVIENFKLLVSHNPENTELRMQLARALFSAKDYLEAEKQVGTILKKQPDNTKALRLMGNICLRTDRRKKGQEYFSRILRNDPEDTEFRVDAARALKDAGEFEESLAEVTKFLKERPASAEGQNLYGEILLEQEKPEEALRHFQKIRDRFPDNGEIIANLARAYQETGSRGAAIEAVDQLINLQGKRGSPEDITRLNESLELYEKAVEAFELDHKDAWERNLNRLGKLALLSSMPAEETDENLLIEEFPVQDEDSIPILDFGGEKIAEEEEEEPQDDIGEELSVLDSTPPLFDLPENGELPPGFGRPGDAPRNPESGETPSAPPVPAPPATARQTQAAPPPPAAPEPFPPPAAASALPAAPRQPRAVEPSPAAAPGPAAAPSPAAAPAEPFFPQQPPPERESPRPSADDFFPPGQAETRAPGAPAGGGVPEESPAFQLPSDEIPRKEAQSPMKKQEEPEPFEEPLEELPDIEIEDLTEPAADGPAEMEASPPGEEAAEPVTETEAAVPAGEPEIAEFADEEEPAELEAAADEEIPAPREPDAGGGEIGPPDGDAVPGPAPDLAGGEPVEESASGVIPVPGVSVGLLDYLLSLTEALPEEKRGAFQRSDYRLKIEALKSRLSGGRGIHTGFPAPRGESRPLDPGTVGKSMQFFARFAALHPEPGIGTLLSEKLKSIAQKISGGSGE